MADTYYHYTNDTRLRARYWKGVSTDNVDADQMEAAAKITYDYINSRLDRAYTVPFSTGADTPAVIDEVAVLLTVVNAKALTGGHGRRTQGPWADYEDRAEKWLDGLVAGTMRIPGVARKSGASGLKSSTQNESRVFNNDSIHDAEQDTDQATRISDERD